MAESGSPCRGSFGVRGVSALPPASAPPPPLSQPLSSSGPCRMVSAGRLCWWPQSWPQSLSRGSPAKTPRLVPIRQRSHLPTSEPQTVPQRTTCRMAQPRAGGARVMGEVPCHQPVRALHSRGARSPASQVGTSVYQNSNRQERLIKQKGGGEARKEKLAGSQTRNFFNCY